MLAHADDLTFFDEDHAESGIDGKIFAMANDNGYALGWDIEYGTHGTLINGTHGGTAWSGDIYAVVNHLNVFKIGVLVNAKRLRNITSCGWPGQVASVFGKGS